jgi:cyclase
MLKPRLIPVLLLRDGGLMKSKQFSRWTYIGDALNTSKIFNDKETDELIVLDVRATLEQREPNYELLTQLAAECFLPIAYGGGVSSPSVARKVTKCGVDKVAVNSAIRKSPELLRQISEVVGSSSTIASIDVSQNVGGYELHNHPDVNLMEYVAKMEELGAGEVLVQAVDRDGMRCGPDLELGRKILQATSLPTVYAGGVSSLEEAVSLWRLGVDGVAAGSWFVFNGRQEAVLVTYPSRKRLDEALSLI